MRSWAERWLGHQVLGGVPGRGVRDAHLRLWFASQRQDNVFVAQDLSRFFDSICVPHFAQVLRHLGAPQQLIGLLSNFYHGGARIFSAQGVVGEKWHPVSRGFFQGCPLSPLMDAAVMHVWVCQISRAKVDGVAFVMIELSGAVMLTD